MVIHTIILLLYIRNFLVYWKRYDGNFIAVAFIFRYSIARRDRIYLTTFRRKLKTHILCNSRKTWNRYGVYRDHYAVLSQCLSG